MDPKDGLDLGVCLESGNGSTFIMSYVKDANGLARLARAHVVRMKAVASEPLDKWGRLQGEGFRLTGTIDGLKSYVKVEIFMPGSPYSNIVFTQLRNWEDQAGLPEDFKLIQDTLTMK
ncbi:MAG: hypothetical protein HQ519_02475 [Planctomycetes bacterium]|nr:hypothetical protein [Planctomycetota bacterium]